MGDREGGKQRGVESKKEREATLLWQKIITSLRFSPSNGHKKADQIQHLKFGVGLQASLITLIINAAVRVSMDNSGKD